MTAVHSFLHCSLYTTGMSHLKIDKGKYQYKENQYTEIQTQISAADQLSWLRIFIALRRKAHSQRSHNNNSNSAITASFYIHSNSLCTYHPIISHYMISAIKNAVKQRTNKYTNKWYRSVTYYSWIGAHKKQYRINCTRPFTNYIQCAIGVHKFQVPGDLGELISYGGA